VKRIALVTLLLVLSLLAWPGQARADPGPVTYVVKPGDTLSRIAAHHRVSLASIIRANRILRPNLIFPGEMFVIPDPRPEIVITLPTRDQVVTSPVRVTGISDTFEATVVVRVLDSRFREIGRGIAHGGTLGTYAPFSIDVPFSVTGAQVGYVEAFWADPGFGFERDVASVRVSLGGEPQVYVVRRGDTLTRIALYFGTTVTALVRANRILNPHLIFVGQRLIIPR